MGSVSVHKALFKEVKERYFEEWKAFLKEAKKRHFEECNDAWVQNL
ncbi:hypothetical protein T4D_10410 [Trichinella pseudospiralis]|uniref:Uncharacterized protein n=1 Tax=Trichinella pseudospiralis TaxID=6337 RepID=A0A0V1DNR2_TRIPS|nr:hypothetical protein T4D_10410 [Trichinella pseudospiralis]